MLPPTGHGELMLIRQCIIGTALSFDNAPQFICPPRLLETAPSFAGTGACQNSAPVVLVSSSK